jgi:hypothetical protein
MSTWKCYAFRIIFITAFATFPQAVLLYFIIPALSIVEGMQPFEQKTTGCPLLCGNVAKRKRNDENCLARVLKRMSGVCIA